MSDPSQPETEAEEIPGTTPGGPVLAVAGGPSRSVATSVLRQFAPPLALLLIMTVTVYLPILFATWVNWDDITYLAGNPVLHSFSSDHFRQILTPGAMPSERLFIPVSYLLLQLQLTLSGGSPTVLLAVNLLLHCANIALVLRLALHLLPGRIWALIATIPFALHPLQVETVAWTMGQRDLLAAAFALLALHAWWRVAVPADTPPPLWPAKDDPRWRWLAASRALYLVACLAKPTVLLLPLLFPLLSLQRDGRRSLRQVLQPLLPFAIIAVAVYILNARASAASGPDSGLVWQAALLRLAYLPAIADGWLARLLLLDAPRALYLNRELDPALISVLAALPLLLLAGGAYILARLRAWLPLAALLAAALLLAPAGQLVLAYNRQFYTADRLVYLAMAPLGLVLAAQLSRLFPRARELPTLPVGILVTSLLIGLTFKSGALVRVWQSPASFWSYQLSQAPANPIAHNNLGIAALNAGDPDTARQHFRAAVAADPSYALGWYGLGVLASQRGDSPAALALFRRAEAEQPGDTDALYATATLLLETHPTAANEAARTALQQLLTARPLHPAANALLARLDAQAGDLPSALARLDRLIAAGQGAPAIYLQRGLLRARQADLPAAEADLRTGLALAPNHADLTYNLAVLRAMQGDAADALTLFRRAADLAPASVDALLELASIHTQLGAPAAALAALREAQARQPNNPTITARLAELTTPSPAPAPAPQATPNGD